jgi:hypothetical protein
VRRCSLGHFGRTTHEREINPVPTPGPLTRRFLTIPLPPDRRESRNIGRRRPLGAGPLHSSHQYLSPLANLVRERLITRLKVAGGSLAQPTRELAFSLGCSKSALGEVLAKLECEGMLVRVAASHGKGLAIRLVGEMAA